MRVVVLAHVFPRTIDDSMGAFLLHLADALAERGVKTDVVVPHAAGLADEETIGSAHVHRFRYALESQEQLAYQGTMHEIVGRGVVNKILFALFNLAFLFKSLSVVWSVKPQVIHAHWWLPDGFVGAIVSILTRTPLVVTTHGTDVEMLRRKKWAIPLARFTFSCARAITCGSTYLRDQLLSLGVADEKRVSVVPMPVNPVFSVQCSVTRAQNLVLTIARLTAQKSIDTLIDAIALVPDARLKIIGDGPERAALEKQTRDLNLQDRVEFVGALPQTELLRYYAECVVFVLPSIREGMGLVFAEALLCGASVIAANSGGVTDIVRDCETGLLVPERDSQALANAIAKILDDRALATRLAENGRKLVQERYTQGQVAMQFANVYQSVKRKT
jgi:glycosyltransferase involved in cell wall biosynthesis